MSIAGLKKKYLSHVKKLKYEKNTKNHWNDETYMSLKPDLLETYMSRASERKSFLYKRTPRKSENGDVKGDQKKCDLQSISNLVSLSESHQNCSLEITGTMEKNLSFSEMLKFSTNL